MAAPSNIKKRIAPDEFDFILGYRPWVNDAFIGPKLRDLVLAYYVSQGESPKRAQEFADNHIQALRAKL